MFSLLRWLTFKGLSPTNTTVPSLDPIRSHLQAYDDWYSKHIHNHSNTFFEDWSPIWPFYLIKALFHSVTPTHRPAGEDWLAERGSLSLSIAVPHDEVILLKTLIFNSAAVSWLKLVDLCLVWGFHLSMVTLRIRCPEQENTWLAK